MKINRYKKLQNISDKNKVKDIYQVSNITDTFSPKHMCSKKNCALPSCTYSHKLKIGVNQNNPTLLYFSQNFLDMELFIFVRTVNFFLEQYFLTVVQKRKE